MRSLSSIIANLQSDDDQDVTDELYALSRSEPRVELVSELRTKLAELLATKNEEIFWRTIILLGIIYPGKEVFEPILNYVESSSDLQSDILYSSMDSLANIMGLGCLSMPEIERALDVFGRCYESYPKKVELFNRVARREISLQEYTFLSVGAL